jgi:hypothetical protein
VVAPADNARQRDGAGAQPLDRARFHAWALSDAAPVSGLWPAYRLMGMHAPDVSSDVRLVAFRVMWRSALDELAEGLFRRLAARNSMALARATN